MKIRSTHHQPLAFSSQLLAMGVLLTASGYRPTAATTRGVTFYE